MPLRNRVDPMGEIIAVPERGALMGNRGGRIHDPLSRAILRPWASRRWIACELRFKGRHHEPMGSGYTSLFFLDEVTTLSAGHRPCFECRRGEAMEFLSLSGIAGGADAFDVIAHRARLEGRAKRIDREPVESLPDGVMVRHSGAPHALRRDHLLRWTPGGYVAAGQVPKTGTLDVLTPKPFRLVLSRGYRPRWHVSAGD
jgi:hypothetical protein